MPCGNLGTDCEAFTKEPAHESQDKNQYGLHRRHKKVIQSDFNNDRKFATQYSTNPWSRKTGHSHQIRRDTLHQNILRHDAQPK